MATNIWQGTDGNWDTGANWSNAAKPAANDVCIFPSTNSQSVTLNHTDENAIDVDLLMLAPGYVGSIGASGSYLYISADQVAHHGSGALWYRDGDGTTDEFLMDGPGTANLDGTSIANIRILRGTVTFAGSLAAPTLVEVGFTASQTSDANLIITAGAGTTVAMNQWGGSVTNASIVTTANVSAGIHTVTVDGAITNLNMTGGTCRYDGSATIAAAVLRGGVLDLSRGDRLVTVTNLTIYPGADLKYNKETVTFTNPVVDYRNVK